MTATEAADATAAHGFSPARLAAFVRDNVLLLLLVPVFLIGGNLVHELAHVVSVYAEGGTVLSFDLVSSRGDIALGDVDWLPLVSANRGLIAMAPTIVWTTMAVGTAVSARWVLAEDAWSRVAVMVGFFLPVTDACLGASALFVHGRSDWTIAFRGYEAPVAVAFAVYVAVFGEVGWGLFRRAWGRSALSAWEFSAVYVTGLLLCALRAVV